MKTDHLFYRLFKEVPSIFFELIGYSTLEAISYQFESVELKQTAFRIDGVFLPIEANNQIPIYFTEVQFQPDSDIYARLFSEIFLYLRLNGSDLQWRAVVIFKNRNLEPNQTHKYPYHPLINSYFVQCIYLNELEITEETSIGIKVLNLIVASQQQVSTTVGQLVSQVKTELVDETLQQKIINIIETIVLYQFPKLSQKELEAMLGIEDLKHTRFAQEMLEEGEKNMKRQTIPRLLERGLSMEDIAQILDLDVEEVRKIIEN